MKKIRLVLLVVLTITCLACLAACADDPGAKPAATPETRTEKTDAPAATDAPPAAVTTVLTKASAEESPSPTGTTGAPANEKGEAIAALARAQLGKTFQMGEAGPDLFDNSGLVYYVHKENGVAIPRTTRAMAEAGETVGKAELAPGDAVFFCNEIGGGIAFTGIYMGDDAFIAAPNEDTPVKTYRLDAAYWTARYITARRF